MGVPDNSTSIELGEGSMAPRTILRLSENPGLPQCTGIVKIRDLVEGFLPLTSTSYSPPSRIR